MKENKSSNQSRLNNNNQGNLHKACCSQGENVIVLDRPQTGEAILLVNHSVNNHDAGTGQIKHKAVKVKEAKSWKKVTIGGISVIALGTAVHAIMKGNEKDDENNLFTDGFELPNPSKSSTVTEPETPSESPVQDTQPKEAPVDTPHVQEAATSLRMATQVHDNMTFGQAFATARKEVGPGGIFEFESEIFSTYQADEWDNLSVSERHAYNEKVNAVIREEPGAIYTDKSNDTPEPNPADFVLNEIKLYPEENIILLKGESNGAQAAIIDYTETPRPDYFVADNNHNQNLLDDEIIPLGNTGIGYDDVLGNPGCNDIPMDIHVLS